MRGGYLKTGNEKKVNKPAVKNAQLNARSVLDACPDGLVSLDDDLRIVLVNRSFIALTGLDCDALSGRSIDALAAQIDRHFVISSVASTLGPDR